MNQYSIYISLVHTNKLNVPLPSLLWYKKIIPLLIATVMHGMYFR